MNATSRGVKHWTAALVTALLLLQTASSHAQQGGAPSAVTMTVRNLTMAHDSVRGIVRTRASGDALNNDTLRYELVFKNPTAIALRNVVFENPLPSNLTFVGGSATTSAPARIEYSADGGKTFAARPMVRERLNGQDIERPATPDQYTHIRWTVTATVAPSATVTARYDARVAVRR